MKASEQHENSLVAPENEFKLHISVQDHLSEAKKLLKFLGHISAQGEKLNGEPSVYNAYIDVYLQFLQLKAKYPNIKLYPSDEVEWVWYCHILRPKYYTQYCQSNFKKLILHELDDWVAAHENPELLQETAQLYEKEFPGEQYLFTSLPLVESKEIKYLETADIYNDWNWYDQIKLVEGFPSEQFLKEGQKGYHDFLAGVSQNGLRIGPFFNIDLWWHAHQIFPQIYIDDCLEMFSEVIYHVPLGTVAEWQNFEPHLSTDTEK